MISIDYKAFREVVSDVISTNPLVCGMKADLEGLKDTVHRHGIVQEAMRADLEILKATVHHQGVVQEAMRADLEILKDNGFRQGVVQEEILQHLKLVLDAVRSPPALKEK